MKMSWMAALAAACLALPGSVQAEEYPNRPVRLIVPFAPGGSTDASARLLAEALGTRLGKPVVVENKAGGGANIGTAFVANAPGDGYTLLLASPTQTINMALYRKPPFDLKRDFVPVAMFGSSPTLLLVNAQFPAKTAAELVAMAKQSPGKITYASSGVGSTTHLAAELFKKAAGIDIRHIPYKGAAPATTDVVGGQVDAMFGLGVTAGPFVKNGRLRALAVAGQKRLAEMPDVPTLQEVGYPGIDVDAWYGILVPTGTPPAVVARLNKEITASMPAILGRLGDLGILPAPTSQPYFTELLDREVKMWAKAVKDSNTELMD